MATEHRLHIVASATHHWLNLSDRPPPPNDRDSFAAVFHGVEKIREIASRICGTHLSHKIRLSDIGRHPSIELPVGARPPAGTERRRWRSGTSGTEWSGDLRNPRVIGLSLRAYPAGVPVIVAA